MIDAAAAIIGASIARRLFIRPRQNLVDAARGATHLVDVSLAVVKDRQLDEIGHVARRPRR